MAVKKRRFVSGSRNMISAGGGEEGKAINDFKKTVLKRKEELACHPKA